MSKGSQFWMQKIANSEKLTNELGIKSLKWIFPQDEDENKEYKLSGLLRKSGIVNEVDIDFWPSSGPRWDAAALSEDRKILYLFEAKAHRDEMGSKCRSDNEDNKKRIVDSMKKAFDYYSSNGKGDFSLWTKGYYQLGNRLAFIYELNVSENRKKLKVEKVELVLLNIVNDSTLKKTERDKWEKHYKEVFRMMTGDACVPDNVRLVYFNAESLIAY